MSCHVQQHLYLMKHEELVFEKIRHLSSPENVQKSKEKVSQQQQKIFAQHNLVHSQKERSVICVVFRKLYSKTFFRF
jgi:hypothetical protein